MPILNPAPVWRPSRSTHLVIWHGCTDIDRQHIEKNGIQLSKSNVNVDFGRGFYTTTIERQARHWAWLRFADARKSKHANQPVVLRFRPRRHDLAKLTSLSFVRGHYDDVDFWSLVQHCRQSENAVIHDHQGPVTEEKHHWYDMVSGPAAASWQQRVAMVDADQLSFHTQDGIQLLNALIQSKRPANYRWFTVS